MKVIIYIAVFFAITAILCLGSILTESDRLDEISKRIRGALTRCAERVLAVVLFPIEAAACYLEEKKYGGR